MRERRFTEAEGLERDCRQNLHRDQEKGMCDGVRAAPCPSREMQSTTGLDGRLGGMEVEFTGR